MDLRIQLGIGPRSVLTRTSKRPDINLEALYRASLKEIGYAEEEREQKW